MQYSDDVYEMPYTQLFYLNTLLTAANAFVILFALIKFLHVFHWLAIVDRMMIVFRRASRYLVAFVFYVLVLWIAAAIFLHLFVGRISEDFNTFSSSLTTISYALAKAYDYDHMRESSPLCGSFTLLVFICFFFFYVHMLGVAILMTSYLVVSGLSRMPEDRTLVGRLKGKKGRLMNCLRQRRNSNIKIKILFSWSICIYFIC